MNKSNEWLDFSLGMYKKLQEMGFGGPWGENNLESLINIAKQMNSGGQEKAITMENEKSLAKTETDLFWKQKTKSTHEGDTKVADEGSQNPFPLSIYESARDITLHAILPGVASQKDLKVLVGEGVLKLTGTRTLTGEGRTESFQRTIVLPSPVDQSSATAGYRNGFLNIRIPKKLKNDWHRLEVDFT